MALLRHQRTAADGQAQRYVHEAQFLDGQSDIIVTTDEDLHSGCNHGGIATFRVSADLTTISELSQWFIGVGTPAAVCSVHVMSTKDDFAFFGSCNAGLQVVDLSEPAKPVRAGQHIAPGANSWGALVHPTAPGYLTYVGDFGGRGLDVLDVTPPGGQEPPPGDGGGMGDGNGNGNGNGNGSGKGDRKSKGNGKSDGRGDSGGKGNSDGKGSCGGRGTPR